MDSKKLVARPLGALAIKSGCSYRFFRAASSPKRWEIVSWSIFGRFLSNAVMLSMITEHSRLRKK